MKTACSLGGLASGLAATTGDVEKHLLQGFTAIAGEKVRWRVVVLDAAALHDDDPVAQPLDLGHVVGGEQHGRAAFGPVALEPRAHPVSGIWVERGGRL